MESQKWIGRSHLAEVRQPVPLVEIANDRRILIENHQGVCSYTTERINVRVMFGQICIYGDRLHIVRMTREQLVICGAIQSVSLERGAKNGR